MLLFTNLTPCSLFSMYTTKPLSLFIKNHPKAAAEPPPEGRNAGYLVVKSPRDELDDETTWFGPTGSVLGLPFPQNRVLSVEYGEDYKSVMFMPVPDKPLSYNHYYVVVASGNNKGLVMVCSLEEDVTMCCLSRSIPDAQPRPFDPADVYQQIEIVQHKRGSFTARAVAAHGFPPSIFRSKYWMVWDRESYKNIDLHLLGEAVGLDAARRLAYVPPGVAMAAVGKWYCPFFLIQEHGVTPRDQMSRGVFYEVVLEQRWEPVRGGAAVMRHADGSSKLAMKVLIGGSIGAKSDESLSTRHGAAYMWFVAATGQRVGVCTMVCERMLWEVTNAGLVDDYEEKNAGSVAYGSVVLVERFVVKRMDASVVVVFDFVHLNVTKAELL